MARYVKVLIDKGANSNYKGLLTIIEVSIYDKENINVARSKSVSVSSSYAGRSGSYITDGSKNSYADGWATADGTGLEPNGSQWAMIDLRNDYYVNKIELCTWHGNGYGAVTDYRIMFSKDNKKYSLAAQVKNQSAATRTDTITKIRNIGYTLYEKNNVIYAVNNDQFTKLNDDWTALSAVEKKALFESTNYETALAEDLATLGKFKVMTYSEMEDKPELSLTAAPKDQLILPKGLINTGSFEGIDKATLTSTASGAGACKILVTNDLTTYKTYDFAAQEWQTVDHTDIAIVKEKGISAADLPTIPRTAWDKITTGKQGIGFAYLLSIENTSDVCSVDDLTLTVDMKGSWDKATHSADYTYGYPANNVLKVMLKSNGDYKINYSEGAKEI